MAGMVLVVTLMVLVPIALVWHRRRLRRKNAFDELEKGDVEISTSDGYHAHSGENQCEMCCSIDHNPGIMTMNSKSSTVFGLHVALVIGLLVGCFFKGCEGKPCLQPIHRFQ